MSVVTRALSHTPPSFAAVWEREIGKRLGTKAREILTRAREHASRFECAAVFQIRARELVQSEKPRTSSKVSGDGRRGRMSSQSDTFAVPRHPVGHGYVELQEQLLLVLGVRIGVGRSDS